MALGKLFYLQHGQSTEGLLEASLDQTKSIVRAADAEEQDVSDFILYHEQYYPKESADIIRFLKHNNIEECGTIESLGLDYFWVSADDLFRNDDGNWTYKGYMLGCDHDMINHLVVDQKWSTSKCIDMVMSNMVEALKQ